MGAFFRRETNVRCEKQSRPMRLRGWGSASPRERSAILKMSASLHLSRQVLNHFLRNQQITAPTQLFLALYTSNPTSEDTGVEITGGSYARMPITFTAPSADTGINVVSNAAEIRFPVATDDWGTISHFGVRDAATGGNLFAFAAVPIPKLIEEGDEAKFIQNALTISLE